MGDFVYRDVDDINDKLLNAQFEWYVSTTRRFIASIYDQKEPPIQSWLKTFEKGDSYKRKTYIGNFTYSFSEPFFTALPNNCSRDKKLIMFVGQEPNGYGQINTFDSELCLCDNGIKEHIKKSQEYAKAFTLLNIGAQTNASWKNYDNQETPLRKNNRAFWKLMNSFSNDYDICWNNLNKLFYTARDEVSNERIPCIALFSKDEEFLNRPLASVGKSLLLYEIEVVKPDYIVFITGPKYVESMNTALNRTDLVFDRNQNSFFVNDIPSLWLYHPNYIKEYEHIRQCIVELLSKTK